MRRVVLIAAGALVLGGCRNDMHHQAKIKPFRESTFFADGASARPLPEGVVARGFLNADAALSRGQGPDGKFVEKIPVPITRALLLRGQERFDIYCSPCHGRTGEGQGMIVQRGFKRPSSYHVVRLRAERAGYFFDVVTNGFGQMSGYAAQVPPEDRWAIVAWIRTLQASRNMPEDFLGKEDEEALNEAGSSQSSETSPAASGHSPSKNSSLSPSPSSPSKQSSISSSSSSPSEAK